MIFCVFILELTRIENISEWLSLCSLKVFNNIREVMI
jgi:hypothetical protein